MRSSVGAHFAYVDVIDEGDRSDITESTLLAEQLQPFESTEMRGSTATSDRFRHERAEMSGDRSVLVVISAVENSRMAVLGCGETLSQILIEATMAGFATSIMTRIVEVDVTRDIVADVTGRSLPQVVVRIGVRRDRNSMPPLAPRRPLSEVLHFAE